MLRTLELAGSPRERGRRHGQVLGEDLRRMRRALLTYLARLSLYSAAVPLFGLLTVLARRLWPYVPPRLQEEMVAVAQGAEVRLGTVLLINVLDDLANNSPRCSALAVGEERTDEGLYLLGRNLDYPLFTTVLTRLQTLFLVVPVRGQPFASLAWPGYVGVCTGMNRAGVGLAQLAAMSRDRTLKGVPAALRFRQALEAGATVAGVAAQILGVPGTIGNNVMLCGPREAMVLELSARRGVVRRPRQGLITATNHYQSPAMQPLRGRFPPRPPLSPLPASMFTDAYSRSRDARLQELARGPRLGPGDLQRILADGRIANPGTVVCTILAPAQGRLWVAQGEVPPVNRGSFTEVRPWG
jgi:hypothetical protein